MQKRRTDFNVGELFKITDTTFHDYKKGETVEIIAKDNYSYHVVNTEGEKRFWWVKENQIKPIKQ